jgi:hypothetical protein
MAIELSSITFTDQADIVPVSGVEEIRNDGIVNTLAGDDTITGISTSLETVGFGISGIYNLGTLNTSEGNDRITGTGQASNSGSGIFNSRATINTGDGNDTITGSGYFGLVNDFTIATGNGNDLITGNGDEGGPGIYSLGNINSGDGDDIITGTNTSGGGYGIFNGLDNQQGSSTIDTGDGNDTITGISTSLDTVGFGISGIYNLGTLNTSEGNDIIIGIAQESDSGSGIFNSLGTINTSDGNDTIRGSGFSGLVNDFTIATDNGNDLITGNGDGGGTGIYSLGNINSGGGDDTITGANNSGDGYGIVNGLGNPGDSSTIDTGDGNDIISGIAAFGIFNTGIINTGSGADSIICDASLNDGTRYGFYNTNTINTGDGNDIITEISGRSIFNLGIINTGNNADSIIAEGGFEGIGSIFLGNGKDYVKGFGRGNFKGENGKDTLELTSGSYTVGISGIAVNFIKDSIIMNTSEFEKLIAGSTIYDFSSLSNGQRITVA